MNETIFKTRMSFFFNLFFKDITQEMLMIFIWEKYNKISQKFDNNFLEKISITTKCILLDPLQIAKDKIKRLYYNWNS